MSSEIRIKDGYQRALLDTIEFPGTDLAVRARLEEEAGGPMSSRSLHDHLTQLDPVSAERINLHGACRIIRALEAIELTGHPYSASMPRHELVAPPLMVALRRLAEELDGYITVRTCAMMDGGFIEEVRTLIGVGLYEAKTVSCATRYAQALAVIDGQMSGNGTMESIALVMRRLARRRVKWLRPDPRVRRSDTENFDSNETVTRHVVELVQCEAESPLGRS